MKKLSVLAAVLCFASPSAYADITIGLAGPLTGQYANFGEQFRRGAEQAVSDINAKGGIHGEKIALRIVDDACDPKQAVTAANQLASAGIKYVVGHFCSGSSIPASKVYAEESIVMISPASTNPSLTDAGLKNVFRICGRDDQQGVVQANYIMKHFPGKRIAVIHDNTTAGKGQADVFKKTLNDAGIKEVLYDAYVPGQKDYGALISKLKSSQVEVLDIGGYHTEAGLITRQIKEQGAKIQIIGGDALVTNELWSITGPAGEGLLMSFQPDARNIPAAKAPTEAMRKGGYEPEGYTLYTYAALQVIAEAIKRAGKDPVKVAESLKSEPAQTIIGTIGFNEKGDVKGSNYVIYQWHDGKYAEVAKK